MLLSLLLAAAEAQEQQETGYDWRILLPFGVVLAALLIMPRILRRNREERRRLEKQFTREVGNRLNIKSDADRIMVDLVESGREINARLDNKIRLLNKLIKDADALVTRFEKARGNESAGNQPQTPVSPVESIVLDESAASTKTVDISRTQQQPADSGIAASSEASGVEESAGSGRWKADMRKRIAGLSAEGRDMAEIARITRMSIAEVSLMLELIRCEG